MKKTSIILIIVYCLLLLSVCTLAYAQESKDTVLPENAINESTKDAPKMPEETDKNISDVDIKDVQYKLSILGYDPGPIDGKWGNKTSAALKALQKIKGIKITGEVDEETKNALNFIQNELEGKADDKNIAEARQLLEKGIDSEGLTPLHQASNAGNADAVKLLLEIGANPNSVQQPKGLATPLHLASENGHTAVVKLLLDAKADVDPVDALKATPLVYASKKGHVDIIKLLLSAGADVNAPAIMLGTPITIAAREGQVDAVKILLKAGAVVNIKFSIFGMTFSPLSVAQSGGHTAIVKILKEHGARE